MVEQQLLDLYREGRAWTPDQAASTLKINVHDARCAVARLYLAGLVLGEFTPSVGIAFRYAGPTTLQAET